MMRTMKRTYEEVMTKGERYCRHWTRNNAVDACGAFWLPRCSYVIAVLYKGYDKGSSEIGHETGRTGQTFVPL